MSTYTLTALCVATLLVLGIRTGVWGFLRLVLLVHLVGDLIFAPLWEFLPTYAWIRYIADPDRQRAALFLALVVCLTDVAYRLVGRVFSAIRFASTNSSASANGPYEREATAEPRSFAISFFLAGLFLKLLFLAGAGVLTGQRALGDLKPDDSVGYGAVVYLADFLIPYGLVAYRRTKRSARVEIDLLILAFISYFSFSKAAFITYVVVYGLAYVFAFGHHDAIRQFISWRLVGIVLVAFLALGIKTQQRAGSAVELSGSVLGDQAMVGASARFMGGIFRAFTVTYREMRAGWPPLGGSYHEQAVSLAVPRFLWPDKPRVASEQLYYLLGVTEEAYGTAFAVNAYGAMLFDFGIAGTLVGAIALGILLRFGDEKIPTWRQLRNAPGRSGTWQFMATAWLFMAIPLSEGGVPIAIVSFSMLAAAYGLIEGTSRLAYRVVSLASLSPPLDAGHPITRQV